MRETEFGTGEVRIKWPQVFTVDKKTGKYAVTCMLPKANVQVKAKMDAAIEAAKRCDRALRLWGGNTPMNLHIPIWDGDGVNKNGEQYGPECKGCWVFTASSNPEHSPKPRVVHRDNLEEEILDASQIYSGMYGIVLINCYPYDVSGNRGIGFGFDSLIKTRDGEVIAGSRRTSLTELVEPQIQTDANGFMQVPATDPMAAWTV